MATSYSISISSKAKKNLKGIDKTVRNKLIEKILRLKKNRYSQQFKPLMGKSIAQFRLRIGDYRVLYDVYDEDETVLILRIGHLKHIYK